MQNSKSVFVFFIRFSVWHIIHPDGMVLHFYKIENLLDRQLLLFFHIAIILV